MTSPLPTLSPPRPTLISLLPHLFVLFDSIPSHLLSHSVLLRHKFLPHLTPKSADPTAADSFPLLYLQTIPSPSVEASRVALEEAGLENLTIQGDEWRVEGSEGSEGGEEGWVAYVRNGVVKKGTEIGVRVVLCAEMEGKGLGMYFNGSAEGDEKKERKWKYYDLQELNSVNSNQIWYKTFQSAFEAFTADLAKASQRNFENSAEEFWDGYSDDEDEVKKAEVSSNGLGLESRIDGNSSIISSQDSANREAAEEADYWSSYDSAFSNSPITSHHASPFASRRPTTMNLFLSNFNSTLQDPKHDGISVDSQILESLENLNLKPSTWSPPTPIKDLPNIYLNNIPSRSNSIDVPVPIAKPSLTSPQEEATPLETGLGTLPVNHKEPNKEILALPLNQQVALLKRRVEALRKEWVQGDTFGSDSEDGREEREKLWKDVIDNLA